MTIEIKHRYTNRVLYLSEKATMKEALEEARAAGADLSGANLRSANLSGAYLRSANLRSANLRSADLSGANLRSANLRSANLRSADLSGADLSGADLSGAYLSGANLRSANLSGAYLRSANLRSANLRSADLRSADLRSAYLSAFKNDMFDVLLRAPNEIAGLRLAIQEGRIDGSCYEGTCACLVGTIANVRRCEYNKLPNIVPDSGRPIEVLFTNIRPGHTPENNSVSKLAVEWIDEFENLLNLAIASRTTEAQNDR